MHADLHPWTVTAVAGLLELRTSEVIRLRVCCGHHSGSLLMSDQQLEEIVSFAGIFSLPHRIREQTGMEYKGASWLLPLLSYFMDQHWVGTATIRMDNMWRGIPRADASVLQQIIHHLVRDQILQCYASNKGKQIAISKAHVDTVREMLSERFLPPSISEFLGSPL